MPTQTWNGNTSTDWNTISNWTGSPNRVPNNGDDVVIGSTTRSPTLGASTSIKSLTLNGTDTLTISGTSTTLTISGTSTTSVNVGASATILLSGTSDVLTAAGGISNSGTITVGANRVTATVRAPSQTIPAQRSVYRVVRSATPERLVSAILERLRAAVRAVLQAVLAVQATPAL